MYVSPAVDGCHRNSFYNCNYRVSCRVTPGINKLIILSLIFNFLFLFLDFLLKIYSFIPETLY